MMPEGRRIFSRQYSVIGGFNSKISGALSDQFRGKRRTTNNQDESLSKMLLIIQKMKPRMETFIDQSFKSQIFALT